MSPFPPPHYSALLRLMPTARRPGSMCLFTDMGNGLWHYEDGCGCHGYFW